MKIHTNEYKNEIKEFGREIDSIITYTVNNEVMELSDDELNSVIPHYEGTILKSIMKQLDIDTSVEIPVGTIINYKFGVKTRNDDVDDSIINDYRKNYDYVNFGNYVVKEIEKQEDTDSYFIKCYDKLLYSMVDYTSLNINYPITIDNYIKAICDYLGYTFKNYQTTYANHDKEIPNELYLTYNEQEEKWESLNYTFKDILDELAQVTASTICINEIDDELEIRYINDTQDTITEEYLNNINVNFKEKYGPINTVILSRSANSDKISLSFPEDLPDNQKKAIEISDNQIMNFNNRDTFMADILNQLKGLEYYLNDFVSTGIGYYNLCDKYNISITKYNEDTDETTTIIYPCIMLNDEFNVINGDLAENIHTEALENSDTDYKYTDTTDKRQNRATLIVDKQNQQIIATVEGIQEDISRNETVVEEMIVDINGITNTFSKSGGNNLWFNSALHFINEDGTFPYWNVEIDAEETDPEYENYKLDVIDDSESLSGTNIILPKGKISQTIKINNYIDPSLYDELPITHINRFLYKKNIDTANCYMTINGNRYKLGDETEWTFISEEIQKLTLTSNILTIEFECDVQGGYYIKDLMLNSGSNPLEYSQNINETNTDTVQISDGILVTSSSTNTESRHDSDGFRILRKDTKEVVLRATENGTETKSIIAANDSEIAGLIIKRYNGHTLLFGKGGY